MVRSDHNTPTGWLDILLAESLSPLLPLLSFRKTRHSNAINSLSVFTAQQPHDTQTHTSGHPKGNGATVILLKMLKRYRKGNQCTLGASLGSMTVPGQPGAHGKTLSENKIISKNK